MPNPVLGRFDAASNGRGPGGPANLTAAQLEDMYAKPAYVPARYMTLDDVVVRTGLMLAVVFGVGNGLQRMVAFLLLPLYTRALTPAQYGALSVLLAVSVLLWRLK